MKSLSDLFRDISNARKAMKAVADVAPRIIGVESVKFVKSNFQIQGYDNGFGVTSWAKRKAATNKAYDRGRTVNSKTGKLSKYRTGKNSTYKGSVYSSSNPLLRQTLTLYNSIQYKISGKRVIVGVDQSVVPYARAHNEGLNHEPKRQYMPYGSQPANPRIVIAVKAKLDYETKKAMRLFKR